MSSSLLRLPAGNFAEITDLITGAKKLVLIDDSGLGYFDLHGEGEIPHPITAEILPVVLGTIPAWIGKLDDARADEWTSVWHELTNRRLDVLTIARAMHFGIQNESQDIDAMVGVAEAEAEQIRSIRDAASRAIVG